MYSTGKICFFRKNMAENVTLLSMQSIISSLMTDNVCDITMSNTYHLYETRLILEKNQKHQVNSI